MSLASRRSAFALWIQQPQNQLPDFCQKRGDRLRGLVQHDDSVCFTPKAENRPLATCANVPPRNLPVATDVLGFMRDTGRTHLAQSFSCIQPGQIGRDSTRKIRLITLHYEYLIESV